MSDDYNPYKAPESDLTKPETIIPEGEKYTPLMVEHLKNTRPWVLFITILFIIFAAFMILGGLGMMISGSFISSAGRSDGIIGGFNIGFLGFIYIVLVGVYIPIIIFLFRYAKSIKSLLITSKTEFIEKSLGYQKSFWKYVGILGIVGISLILIIMVLTIIFSIMNIRNFN